MVFPEFEYVHLPRTFVTLLKASIVVPQGYQDIWTIIRPDKSTYLLLEKVFTDFDDGRGLEKLVPAMGWQSFRDRMASVYVYHSRFGRFPQKTDMDVVQDIKMIEARLSSSGVHSYSRIFLLCFYLKLLNVKQNKNSEDDWQVSVPVEIDQLLAISGGRTEKIDWLVLVLWNFSAALGYYGVSELLSTGKTYKDIYSELNQEQKNRMTKSLLVYGASIQDPEIFTFERV